MSKLPPLLTAMLVPMVVGCGVGEGTGSTPPWVDPPTPTAPATTQSDAPPAEIIDPFQVRLQTTKGDILIDVHPEWAPRGAKRFRDLVEAGYYDDNRVFRVVPGFVVQFGMHGDPDVNRKWNEQRISDDPVTQSNQRGYVTFATSGPNARTTQIFINLKNNPQLDTMEGSFAPFGEVAQGMDVVESFNAQYEEAPSEKQPQIAARGNEFLDAQFPGLDSIVKATIVDSTAGDAEDVADEGQSPPDQSQPQ